MSGTLLAIQTSGSEIPPTPGPGAVARGEQSEALKDCNAQSILSGEEAQEAHRGDQAPSAHSQGEASSEVRHTYTDKEVPAGEQPIETAEVQDAGATTNENDEDKHASMAPRIGKQQLQASQK